METKVRIIEYIIDDFYLKDESTTNRGKKIARPTSLRIFMF